MDFLAQVRYLRTAFKVRAVNAELSKVVQSITNSVSDLTPQQRFAAASAICPLLADRQARYRDCNDHFIRALEVLNEQAFPAEVRTGDAWKQYKGDMGRAACTSDVETGDRTISKHVQEIFNRTLLEQAQPIERRHQSHQNPVARALTSRTNPETSQGEPEVKAGVIKAGTARHVARQVDSGSSADPVPVNPKPDCSVASQVFGVEVRPKTPEYVKGPSGVWTIKRPDQSKVLKV